MDLGKYRELYLAEAGQQLATMETGVQTLSGSPADAEPLAVVSRAAHTLKGMSAMMGYRQLAELAGEVESLLDARKPQTLPVTAELGDLLRDCVDALRLLLQDVADGNGRETELGPLLRRLEPFRYPDRLC
jgi:two-component system chemotaxis sensor kinase CheA